MVYIRINPNYTEVKISKNICKWEQTRSAKYWEYRKKWSENPKKQIVGKFPLHLDIESTRKCNLLCPMCPRTIKINRGEKLEEDDIDFDLAKKVIDEGAANGLYSIKFSYLGEPLMNRRLPELIKYAKDKGIIDTMFNTNATLLTEYMSRKLIKAGLDKLFISFDSPFKEKYNKIRVGTDFDTVFNNVKRFVEIRNELGSLTPIVRVSMVVMKENKCDVLDYIKLWKDVVDLIGFSYYVNPQGMDKNDRYAIELKAHKNFICPQLYQRLFVHYNGKIGLCCVDYDAELNLGNAWKNNIKDVWLGEKLQNIRKLHNKGRWKEIELCKRCHLPYI
jgi:radical SAM protein with 4Fe4S-binding SPASM domain